MNNDSLLFQVACGVQNAMAVTKTSWEKGAMSHPDAVRLRDSLQSALTGAQELERRAAGVPPPKIGD